MAPLCICQRAACFCACHESMQFCMHSRHTQMWTKPKIWWALHLHSIQQYAAPYQWMQTCTGCGMLFIVFSRSKLLQLTIEITSDLTFYKFTVDIYSDRSSPLSSTQTLLAVLESALCVYSFCSDIRKQMASLVSFLWRQCPRKCIERFCRVSVDSMTCVECLTNNVAYYSFLGWRYWRKAGRKTGRTGLTKSRSTPKCLSWSAAHVPSCRKLSSRWQRR